MRPETRSAAAALYRLGVAPGRSVPPTSRLEEFVASTPGTRRIVNDPACIGVDYTSRLSNACADILKLDSFGLTERETHVVNILRGGLNYGLREALHTAFGWTRHATCFLSAQRVCDGPEGAWRIDENAYRKLYFGKSASLLIGDVVATGTSLRYALDELVSYALRNGTALRRIVFFTFGGELASEILAKVDARCRELFPGYVRTVLIYLEGRFLMARSDTPVTIRIPDTDLMRLGAEMAPEFIESEYESPAYPIERCTIYDAGSRAFHPAEHLADAAGYWRQVLELAEGGMTFAQLLKERFPGLDPARFGAVDLAALARERIGALTGTDCSASPRR